MRNPKSTSTSSAQYDTPTPMDRLHDSAIAAGMSGNARALLTKLVLWSGTKGFCWWSVPKIAREIERSQRQVRRLLRELEGGGYLTSVPDPGRTNYLIPYPSTFHGALTKLVAAGPRKRMSGVSNSFQPSSGAVEVGFSERGKKNLQNKTLAGEPPPAVEIPSTGEPGQPQNALDIGPSKDQTAHIEPITAPLRAVEPAESPVAAPQRSAVPPVEQAPHTRTYEPKGPEKNSLPRDVEFIVEQIEQVTGDHHSRGAFIRIARNVDEQAIYLALSSVKCAMDCGTVYRPGGYFIGVVKAAAGFSFRGSSPGSLPDKKPSVAPWCSLNTLQGMHPHLLVEPLWKRYRDLVAEANLEKYRLFLQVHSDEIWHQKPCYRRL